MFAPIIPAALTLLFLSLAPAPGRCFSYMAEEDGNSVCEICECDFKRIPYFVDCSSKSIKSMLTNWNIDYPEETGHSEIMIDVDFSDNLIDEIPAFPADLPIRTLYLRNNRISRISDKAFAELKFLTNLDLGHNQLTVDDISSKVFQGLQQKSSDLYEPLSLLELNLGYNKLTSVEGTTFEHLAHLKSLNLDGNILEDIDTQTSKAISSLGESLEVLSLKHSTLKKLPESIWLNLGSLETLDLSSNFINSIPEGELQLLKQLKKLILDDNNFKIIGKDTFVGLESLTSLSLKHMLKLEKIDAGAFGTLPKLRDLYIQNNIRLKWIHPDVFEGIHVEDFELKNLHLSGNDLRYLPQELLPDTSNWKDLEVLDLGGNPWNCDCHNEWLAFVILAQIQDRDPKMAAEVKCGGPGEMAGRKMLELAGKHPTAIPCNPADNFNPHKEDYGVDPNGPGSRQQFSRSGDSHADSLAVGVAVVCILAIVASICFVGGLYMQKRRQVHYRSLYNDSIPGGLNNSRQQTSIHPGPIVRGNSRSGSG